HKPPPRARLKTKVRREVGSNLGHAHPEACARGASTLEVWNRALGAGGTASPA
ncbi:unnamed protein product, partial [Rangifer tarandus platyrhynchus]